MQPTPLNTKFVDPKIVASLTKLIPHLRSNEFTLVGGIVLKHFFAQGGLQNICTTQDNFDLIAKSRDTVKPSITRNFQISHYHYNPTTVDPFYFSLFDPVTKTFINIFNSNILPAIDVVQVSLDKLVLTLRSLEDQFTVSLTEEARILTGINNRVEDKKLADLELMAKIVYWSKAAEIWDMRAKTSTFDKFPYTLEKTWKNLHTYINNNPNVVVKRKTKTERLKQPCEVCVKSKSTKYPLTPNEEIIRIL